MDFGCYFNQDHKVVNVYPLRKIVFEGYLFNAPNNVDAYLTETYGNWRDIPDSNEIHTHNVEILFEE